MCGDVSAGSSAHSGFAGILRQTLGWRKQPGGRSRGDPSASQGVFAGPWCLHVRVRWNGGVVDGLTRRVREFLMSLPRSIPCQRVSPSVPRSCELQDLVRKWRSCARREVLWIRNDHGPACGSHRDMEMDLADLDRGVSVVRVEVPHCADRVARHELDRLATAGGVVRIGEPADHMLLIVDRRMAVHARMPDMRASAELVTDPLMVRAMVALALDHVRRSWPLSLVGPDLEIPEFSPAERRVLDLLTACTTDVEAARRLGITDRQFRRYIHALQLRLGVRNRFQLGARSAELHGGQAVSAVASGTGHRVDEPLEGAVTGTP